jgi:hypothetical protein
MKTEQRNWTRTAGWVPASCGPVAQSAQLVLVFGATVVPQNRPLMESIRALYPTSADTKTQTHGFPFSKAMGTDRAGDPLCAITESLQRPWPTRRAQGAR